MTVDSMMTSQIVDMNGEEMTSGMENSSMKMSTVEMVSTAENQNDDCGIFCTCATKIVPGKILIDYDLSSHDTPCVCCRLLDPHDSLSGWDNPPLENGSYKHSTTCAGNKNKKPLPYSRVYQKEQPEVFVFKHYRDSRQYIEQYRHYHTKGTVKSESGVTPALGYDLPDPYLPKLRSIRTLTGTDAKVLADIRTRLQQDPMMMDPRSRTLTCFQEKRASHPQQYHSDDKRVQNFISLSQLQGATSHERTSSGSHSASSGGSDHHTRPHTTASRFMDEINLAPTRDKLVGEKKQPSDIQSSYMDLHTPRATFPLPVRIVEDYQGITGSKARVASPKHFKPLHHPSTSNLSPRTSHSQSHLQETIALMQKFPENQTNVSNMILSAISDPTVYQHYLSKLRKVENGQPGALLVGTTVSRMDKPKRAAPKDKNVQVGLCELYSSGNGLYTGSTSSNQNVVVDKEKPREPLAGPLSRLDVRGCQYRGSATRKSLGPRRKIASNGVRRMGSADNE